VSAFSMKLPFWMNYCHKNKKRSNDVEFSVEKEILD